MNGATDEVCIFWKASTGRLYPFCKIEMMLATQFNFQFRAKSERTSHKSDVVQSRGLRKSNRKLLETVSSVSVLK